MATTCTVTAMITDPSQTNLLGNAYVKFRLRNFLGFVPQVSGTSVMCEDTIVAYPNPAGVISQVITCNTAISPVNTFYTVEFWNQGRLTSSANYFFNSSIDLSVAQEINPPPPPPYYGGSGSGSSSTSSPVGSNVAILPALQSGAGGLAGYTLVLRIPAGMIAAVGSKIKVGLSFYSITSVAINAATVGATLPNPVAGVGGFSYNYSWTTAPIAFTWPVGSFANASQIYLSNAVAIPVDAAHDLYVMVYLDPSHNADSPYNYEEPPWTLFGGYILGNHTNEADASTVATAVDDQVFSQVVISA